MREFNTSGPCHPALHYTVMREALIAEAQEKIKKGRYFTLFAPRQAGKTTFFQLMIESLKASYTAIWISFENLSTVNKEAFYQDFDEQLKEELLQYGIQTNETITDPRSLAHFFKTLDQIKPIVLVIDEFEGIPDCVLSEVMHTFRKIYHKREYYCLHSLLLVGVSTIAELVISSASPFNITEELQIPYFTEEEVTALIGQYVSESGQTFEKNVIKAIYENSTGQPGLVCALCSHLITKVASNQSVLMADFYTTLGFFLTKKFDKNILNIVQKAKEKQEFMIKLLFKDEPVAFTIDDPNIAWLYANGVVDETDGYVDMPVPLYAKRLINAFRPSINGETQHYIHSANETINQYLTPDGYLNINELLKAYRAYVRRRGFRAFDTEHLKEAAWHYSLDGFINFFIQRLGGQTYVEVPSGRGRTDILIRHQCRTDIIETKVYSDNSYFKRGKGQLADYLKSESLSQGYYVVFSNIHTEKDKLYSEEVIQEKRIYTHIILTHFEQSSRLPVPDELKLTAAEKIANNMLKMETFSIEQIQKATGVSLDRIKQLSAL